MIVTDTSAAAVTGLQEKDFSVSENGVARPVIRFIEATKGDTAKVHARIAVDGLNGGPSALHRQVKEIKEVLGRLLNPVHPFYKIEFDPAVATKADDFRTVAVKKVAAPGATARTMHSYFEQP